MSKSKSKAIAATTADAADQMAVLQAAYGEERDLLNQLLGQAQAFQAAGQLLQTFGVSKLAYVKENKLYRQLTGTKSPNGLELKGTWEEFCGLLGISDEKANQDIANLQSFGEAALEQMQRMGIGYRELRQYRRLPEDQKQALIEVAKTGDKEGFVELAEEIIARHAKEKDALHEARASLEAKDKVLAENSQKINELAVQLELAQKGKFEPPAGSQARNANEQALLNALDEASSSAYLRLNDLALAAEAALADGPDFLQLRGRHALEFVAQQLADVLERLGVEVDFAERVTPDWLDPEALAVLERRNAEAGQ